MSARRGVRRSRTQRAVDSCRSVHPNDACFKLRPVTPQMPDCRVAERTPFHFLGAFPSEGAPADDLRHDPFCCEGDSSVGHSLAFDTVLPSRLSPPSLVHRKSFHNEGRRRAERGVAVCPVSTVKRQSA
jgi:hypothetical protein